MKFLITGSSGFIGSKILKELINYDSKVKVILRESFKNKIYNNHENIDYIFVDDLFNKDVNWWIKVLEGIDCVIHSAWYTEPAKYLNSYKNFLCLKVSLNILEAMDISKIKYFVGIGTCFEYDFKYSINDLSTSTPLNAKSPYTLAKVSLLNALKILEKTSDFKFAWCRVFYVFGDGEDERRLVPYIHKMLQNSEKVYIKNGDLVRDYINVEEAGNLIAKIAYKKLSGEFNICSGKGKKIKNIAMEIGEIYNKKELIIFKETKEKDDTPAKIIGKKSDI